MMKSELSFPPMQSTQIVTPNAFDSYEAMQRSYLEGKIASAKGALHDFENSKRQCLSEVRILTRLFFNSRSSEASVVEVSERGFMWAMQ